MLKNHKTVLLVDDNVVDLKINSKIIELSKLFEKIITCQSAEDGLDYINKAFNGDGDLPDLILLDIQMPDMDGFEFLERYKQLPSRFKDQCLVAMLSSTLDFGDIQRAEASLHVAKLLKKPLNIKELKELLKLHFTKE